MNFFSEDARNNYNFNKNIFQTNNTPKKQYRCVCPLFKYCSNCKCCSNCSCPSCSNIRAFSKERPYCFALIISGICFFIILLIVIIAVAVDNNKNKNKKGEENKGENKDYLSIYDNIGNNDKGTLEEFCSYLNSKASHLDEEGKVKLAYKWVTTNIEYDLDYVNKNPVDGRDPDKFFKDRKTVCTGYAHLFYRLLIAMNYKEENIRNITGIGKGEGYSVFIEPEVNHEWNAVKINGDWCLLDATWDKQKTNYSYFCTKPECFGREHWPEKSEYQFVKNPISKETFHDLVNTNGLFCKYNMEINEDKSVYEKCEGRFTVKYDYDYEDILKIKYDEKNIELINNPIDKGFEVDFKVKTGGQYELGLYMLNGTGSGPEVGTVYLKCNK